MDQRQVAVAFAIGAISEESVVAWADEQLALDLYAETPEVLSLAISQSRDPEGVRAALTSVMAAIDPEFVVESPEGERIARFIVAGTCKQFLDGQITPYRLCRLVTPVESRFDFPAWLGDLYDVCDWIEPETSATEALGLKQEALRLWQTAASEVSSGFRSWLDAELKGDVPQQVSVFTFYMYEGFAAFDLQLVGHTTSAPEDPRVPEPQFTTGENLFGIDRLFVDDSWRNALELASSFVEQYLSEGSHRAILRTRAVTIGFVDGDETTLWSPPAA